MEIKDTWEDKNSFDQAFYSLADDWSMYMYRCDELGVNGTDDSKDDEISYGLLDNIVYYVLGTWFHDEGQLHLDLEHCYKTEWVAKLEEALNKFEELQKSYDE